MSGRQLWIDTQGEPVITTTPNGKRNAVRWGWTRAVAVPECDAAKLRAGGGAELRKVAELIRDSDEALPGMTVRDVCRVLRARADEIDGDVDD